MIRVQRCSLNLVETTKNAIQLDSHLAKPSYNLVTKLI